jgi:hypothetical protein
MTPIETRSLRLEARWLVSFQTPEADVERIMAAVTAVTPLVVGAYDGNAYQSAAVIERYRPRAGAAAGAEEDLRRRPGVVDLSFEIERNPTLLEAVVEAIYETHGYQEPVIRLCEILASRTKGLDDSANPNRWWNREGDWKAAGA